MIQRVEPPLHQADDDHDTHDAIYKAEHGEQWIRLIPALLHYYRTLAIELRVTLTAGKTVLPREQD